MASMRPVQGAFLSAVFAFAPAAQVHTRTPLVRGQDVTFGLQSANPGNVALFGISATGTGPAACFPPPLNLCVALQPPVVWTPPVPVAADGTAGLTLITPRNLRLVRIATQAFSIALPSLSGASTNTIEQPVLPLSSFNDSFDGPTLDPSWQIYNAHLVNASLSGGELHLRPTQAGPPVTWYADGEGPLIYKLVRGDFEVRATVRSYDPDDPARPPPVEFRMGGITLRDPASTAGARNWLHIAVGGGTQQVPIAVEDKTTTLSTSSLRLTALSAARAEIRVVRQAPMVTFSYRESPTAQWTALRSIPRPDLPAVLQVGLNVYSWQAPNNVVLSVDEIRFAQR